MSAWKAWCRRALLAAAAAGIALHATAQQSRIEELLKELEALRSGAAETGASPQIDLSPAPTKHTPMLRPFGLQLVAALPRRGNALVSPYGIGAALAMLAGGGDREFRQAVARTTGFGFPPTESGTDSMAVIDGKLARAATNTGVQLNLASKAWIDQHANIPDSFARSVRAETGSDIETTNIRDASGVSRINAWVTEATRGQIKAILTLSDTRNADLVLTDAFYFHGDWTRPFDPAKTTPQPFRRPSASQVDVQLMRLDGHIPFHDDPDFQAVELSYAKPDPGKGWFTLVLVLPKDAAADPLALLNRAGDRLESAFQGDSFETDNGSVLIPRTDIDVSVNVLDALKGSEVLASLERPGALPGLGMRDAGTVSVVQRSVLKVDEHGTTAAAATAGILTAGISHDKPFTFRADRPFWLCLREATTGTVLLLGIVREPGS